MRRILIASVAVVLLAACESATAPTSPERSLSATTPRFSGDSIPNDRCASGWSVPDGRCL
ncbi:MAG: hypothetical protein ACJ8AD_20480 [Gemmatimonadaceae bacterium]